MVAKGNDPAVHGFDAGIVLKLSINRGQPFTMANAIIIGIDDDFGAAFTHRDVARLGHADRVGMNVVQSVIVDGRQRCSRPAVRALVNNDQFVVGERVGQHRCRRRVSAYRRDFACK